MHATPAGTGRGREIEIEPEGETVEETPSIYVKPLHFSHGSPAGAH